MIRRTARVLAVLAASLAAGSCSGDEAEPAGTATPTRPTTHVEAGGPAPTSQLSVSGGGQQSAVEVRVGQVLSQLEATQRSEGTVITLPERVLFDFDRANLKPDAATTLDQVAEVVTFYADARVSITGHTDSMGSDGYNDDLSRRRAEAVRDDLVTRHRVSPRRLEAVGVGKRQPVAPNTRPDGSDDPAGRQQNRRVEIVLLGVRR